MIYFQKEEFPEMNDFMKDVAQSLGFELRKYSVSYREGMEDLVDNQNIKVRLVFDSFVVVDGTPGYGKYQGSAGICWAFCC